MDQQQLENTLNILKTCRPILIISDELQNRIPKKHHEIFTDLLNEIEEIADKLMDLENELYFEYITKLSEKE